MSSLASTLASALETDRRNTLRPSQRAPAGDWTFWLLLAGRGFGKNHAGSSWVLDQVESGAAKHIALIAATAADARATMLEGSSGVLTLSPEWNKPTYESSKRRVTWPNGAVATLFTAEEPDRLRGPNHDAILMDEFASWQNQRMTFDMAMMTLRLGKKPRCVITTTPRPSKLLKSLIDREGQDVVITRGGTYENSANLASSFLEQITRRYGGTRLGRQELEAELLEDVEGALWTRDMIERARISPVAVPPLKRIVVAIDPAGSVGEDSDETAIVVAGLGENDFGYILGAVSGKWLPPEWAAKAISLYRKWHADRIVAEKNLGGDMVEHTIRAIDSSVSFRAVTASRGKLVRAEPCAALFEQDRVKIAGSFAQLEDELCSYCGTGDSPNLLDAMVWALTDLMVAPRRPELVFGSLAANLYSRMGLG
jgi:predicted phage terminase large subunit-like protein